MLAKRILGSLGVAAFALLALTAGGMRCSPAPATQASSAHHAHAPHQSDGTAPEPGAPTHGSSCICLGLCQLAATTVSAASSPQAPARFVTVTIRPAAAPTLPLCATRFVLPLATAPPLA